MEPTELTEIPPRSHTTIREMAVAVQANVVQLKVAATRRTSTDDLSIRTPPPGAVRAFRETLIEPHTLSSYDDGMVAARLREVWGQFCLFCWFFQAEDPHTPPAFAGLPDDHEVRCPSVTAVKIMELERSLWRLRFEQRMRSDPRLPNEEGYDEQYRAAMEIPVSVMGLSIQVADDSALFSASCEFAGMLAAARWIGDQRWSWGQPGIMDLPEI
jgi:hypothetical protein